MRPTGEDLRVLRRLPRLSALKAHWKSFALSFFAGILLAAAFPKLDFSALAWVAPGLIVGIACAERGTAGGATSVRRPAYAGRRAFVIGFVAGLGNYLVSLYWLLLIPFPWYGLAAYLALSAIMALFLGGWCWLCWFLLPGGRAKAGAGSWSNAAAYSIGLWWPLICAAAWVAMEMSAARVLTGFPWNFLGVSQARFTALIQVAALGGVYSVSFLVAWASVSLLCVWFRLRDKVEWRIWMAPMLPAGVALCLALVYGWVRLHRSDIAAGQLRIALVQPSIPQRLIWDQAASTNRLNTLLKLSRQALDLRPDLLVWPETAMPELVSRNRLTQEAVLSLLRPHPVWMVLGASDFEAPAAGGTSREPRRYNASFLINPSGEMAAIYHKRHLVPFGEFMPGARWVPALGKLRGAGAGLSWGSEGVIFQTLNPKARFPVLICYEDMFPHEVRARIDDETDFLLNLTNNGWFGESAAQWQHARNALFRAVELGLPLVRCANNGLTCWIDPQGRARQIYFEGTPNIYQAGFKLVEIPLAGKTAGQHPTFYRRCGDWFGWACVTMVTGAVLVRLNRARRLRFF